MHSAAHREAQRIREATYAFLAAHQIDQPFDAKDFAVRVGLDIENAMQLLHDLAERGDVHASQGGWQPGPEPLRGEVDQL